MNARDLFNGILRDHADANSIAAQISDLTCMNHPERPFVMNFDGDYLCWPCAEAWVRPKEPGEMK